jgi:uncharacterized membrane protein
MKKLFLALAFALSFLPGRVFAADLWKMDAFEAEILVNRDGSIEVTETVSADFLQPRHGIFRYLPIEGKDTAGRRFVMRTTLLGISDDQGHPYGVFSYKENGNQVWRIGDPNVTLTGKHVYVIRYLVKNAVGFFEDHDELYWNVTGEQWDVPVSKSKAMVILPEKAPEDALKTACYTGPYGSKASACQAVLGVDRAVFGSYNPGEPMTVVFGWPKGLVEEPTGLAKFFGSIDPWTALSVGLFVLLPVLTVMFMYRKWRNEGDDPEPGTLVVQYEPPFDLRPAEVKALLSMTSGTSMLAPTIVDLAVRGYLSIEETEKGGIFGKKKDYTLWRKKEWKDDETLKIYEKDLLDDLLPPGVESVVISTLREKFYQRAQKFASSVMAGLVSQGYFPAVPAGVTAKYVLLGILVGMIGWFVISGGLFAAGFGLILSAVAIIGFGRVMPKRTEKGAAAFDHIRGYKEFISKVEQYRAPWMETQNVFEKTLPFALAFGLGAKWSQAFAGLAMQPPDWYRGTGGLQTWSAVSFADNLTSMSSTFNSVAVSQPPQARDSGSGFGGGGGGGFSGGGGGGGGGGSW